MSVVCCTCGDTFEPKNRNRPAKTCSRACTNRMVWQTTPDRRCGPLPQERAIGACGQCGRPVKWAQRPGRQGRFCSRTCAGRSKSKGGIEVSKDGRTRVRMRDGGKQLYSRCLMEGHLKRHLTYDEVVHHVNGNPADDRIENLQLLSRSEHRKVHEADMTAGTRKRHALARTHARAT